LAVLATAFFLCRNWPRRQAPANGTCKWPLDVQSPSPAPHRRIHRSSIRAAKYTLKDQIQREYFSPWRDAGIRTTYPVLSRDGKEIFLFQTKDRSLSDEMSRLRSKEEQQADRPNVPKRTKKKTAEQEAKQKKKDLGRKALNDKHSRPPLPRRHHHGGQNFSISAWPTMTRAPRKSNPTAILICFTMGASTPRNKPEQRKKTKKPTAPAPREGLRQKPQKLPEGNRHPSRTGRLIQQPVPNAYSHSPGDGVDGAVKAYKNDGRPAPGSPRDPAAYQFNIRAVYNQRPYAVGRTPSKAFQPPSPPTPHQSRVVFITN